MFKYKHRNVRANWEVSSNFPDEAVIRAYLKPIADTSDRPFHWAEPDWAGLRAWCATRLGLANKREHIDRLLKPLIEAAADKSAQARMELYFREDDRVLEIESQRLREAVRGLEGKAAPRAEDAEMKKRRLGKLKEGKPAAPAAPADPLPMPSRKRKASEKASGKAKAKAKAKATKASAKSKSRSRARRKRQRKESSSEESEEEESEAEDSELSDS